MFLSKLKPTVHERKFCRRQKPHATLVFQKAISFAEDGTFHNSSRFASIDIRGHFQSKASKHQVVEKSLKDLDCNFEAF